MTEQEQIIFMHADGTPTGETGSKLASHNGDTKLHLAFSCYILRRSDSKFLVTQRALSKKVWPGVWSNSFCGHPSTGEAIEDAIRRRGSFELGLKYLENIQCIIPKYIYKTPPYKGIVEHEFCPIFVAYVTGDPKPNPDEVEAYEWLGWGEYAKWLHEQPDKMSWWCKDQYRLVQNVQPFLTLSKA